MNHAHIVPVRRRGHGSCWHLSTSGQDSLSKGAYHRMLFFHLHCAAVHGRSRVESVTSSDFIAQRHGQAPIRICLHATPFPGQSDCACDAHIVCAGGLTCWLVQVDFVLTRYIIFNPWPSIADMIMHEFGMRSDCQNYNLSGQDSCASVTLVSLARELLTERFPLVLADTTVCLPCPK